MSKTIDLLHQLNPQQIKAVHHFEGPALVVAGPGSGKTRVLTHRAAHLISNHNVSESNILCVTFTNKAAGEIKSRVSALLSESGAKLPWAGTFHSICARILRKEGKHIDIPITFVIYDTDDQLSLIKEVLKDFAIDPKKTNPHAVLSTISSAKSELINPADYTIHAHTFFQKIVAKIYPEYQKRLRKNEALDFDDLLMETVKLFETQPEILNKYQTLFRFIMVDEYQDTNKAQYIFCKLLARAHKNLFVVGDMSQAIYSFRGADYRNILMFEKDYKDAVIYNLEQNYRSTQIILDAAKNVIKNNPNNLKLDLWTDNAGGDKIISYTGYDEKEEARFIVESIQNEMNSGKSFKDFAILYRTNAQSRNLEEFFIRNNIPYRIVGGQRFYARKEIKDVISYLRVIHNPKDSVAWERIINVPTRGVGKKSIEILKMGGWDLDEIKAKTRLPIHEWIKSVETHATSELLDLVLQDTGYIQWLNDGTEESKSRVENIYELKSVAAQFTELSDFLENVALIESSDKPRLENIDVVTMMTIHASKGLEFPIVFIAGMEESLFPHSQSMGESEGLEEERRLCYVAITRAMQRLYLTLAKSRMYFGNTMVNLPSRFLNEIPKELLDLKGIVTDRKFVTFGPKVGVDDFLDDMDVDRRNFSWD